MSLLVIFVNQKVGWSYSTKYTHNYLLTLAKRLLSSSSLVCKSCAILSCWIMSLAVGIADREHTNKKYWDCEEAKLNV